MQMLSRANIMLNLSVLGAACCEIIALLHHTWDLVPGSDAT